jgi:two-component system, NarL family, nitrate/nitrite response regulator NarL
MTTVFLADDHCLFTDLVGGFLDAHGFELVGVAATEAEALDGVRTARPDVCLVDPAALATGPTPVLLTRLARSAPGTRLVVLTAAPHDPDADAALRAGASGYVTKNASGAELLDTVERVMRGERVVDDGGAEGGPAALAPDVLEAHRRAAGLRARERECLDLIASGASTEEMAAAMGVTVATVRSHVRAVLAALGVHSRLGAASFALRHGLARPLSHAG